MKIEHLMRTDVVTATPDMSLKGAAAKLVEHGISGMPVRDGRRHVVGVLSEADILYKEQGPSERDGVLAWLLQNELPSDAAKVHARTVGEAMTSPAITIGPHRPASAAARLMIGNGINRLPVVALDGTLVGIVTRADLVRAFIRSDADIAHDIRLDAVHTLWLEPSAVEVSVRGGEVQLAGEVETSADAELVEGLAARTPGVVAVRSDLRHRA
jgi:CBS domain-containing protein